MNENLTKVFLIFLFASFYNNMTAQARPVLGNEKMGSTALSKIS
ncbi:hypothetical protein BC749_101298 [Flavobacterium araucananum]|nr:hypothetical protein BC749_101298 [Flavobacterium araucananum]